MSTDVLIHELAHGLNYTETRNGVRPSDSEAFKSAYAADAGKGPLASDYYHNKGGETTGAYGRDEAFAESFAMFKAQPDLMKQQSPNLYHFMQQFSTEKRR